MNGSVPNGPAIETLVDQLVMAATGQKSVSGAWRSMVAPSDHVGIKIAAAGGRDFSTHAPIVAAVLRGLAEAGVPMSQVVIWDRAAPEAAGYRVVPGGPGVRHIEPFTGYEPKALVTMPSVGRLIWGDAAFQSRGPSQFMPFAAGAVLRPEPLEPADLRPEQDHQYPGARGIGGLRRRGSIYNVTVPNVDNWRSS